MILQPKGTLGGATAAAAAEIADGCGHTAMGCSIGGPSGAAGSMGAAAAGAGLQAPSSSSKGSASGKQQQQRGEVKEEEQRAAAVTSAVVHVGMGSIQGMGGAAAANSLAVKGEEVPSVGLREATGGQEEEDAPQAAAAAAEDPAEMMEETEGGSGWEVEAWRMKEEEEGDGEEGGTEVTEPGTDTESEETGDTCVPTDVEEEHEEEDAAIHVREGVMCLGVELGLGGMGARGPPMIPPLHQEKCLLPS